MCGRYYVDDDTAKEIEKFVRDLDKKLVAAGKKDVYPSSMTAVLKPEYTQVGLGQMRWGFPGFVGKELLINARAESVLEKRTFKESVLHRRCVIPAKGFYEWNPKKEKYQFERLDQEPVLFMAGCFQTFREEDRFVILTTQANDSVSAVHHRMPLVLEKDEIENWILDDQSVEFILHKTPPELMRRTDYEQMKLFS